MSQYAETIERIRGCDVNKSIKLTGVYLLQLAEPVTGHLRIEYEAALQVTEIESVATLRGHLSQLKQAGILEIYHCNGAVDLTFAGYAARAVSAEMLAGRAPTRATHAKTRAVSAKSRATPTFVVNQGDGYAKEEEGQRALGAQNRALHQHFCAPSARDFRETIDPLYISEQAGAGGLVGWLDISNQPMNSDLLEPTNQPTNQAAGAQDEPGVPEPGLAVIDAVEQARSYALLVAVGMKANNAKRYSSSVQFELVRRAVGHWWLNRKSVGGKFEEGPGIVATWLATPDEYPMPGSDLRFLRSELGQRFLLPVEVERLRRLDEEAKRQMVSLSGDEGGEPAALDLDDLDIAGVWLRCQGEIERSIPGSAYAAHVANTTLAWREGVLVVGCESEQSARWVNERLRSLLRSTLTHLVGQTIPFDCLRIEVQEVNDDS